jgi:large subunit ribosomal protein L32
LLISRLIDLEEIMPNPKRRHSKARTRERRAHDALSVPQFYIDKNSGEAKIPHRIDAKTGTYKGRQIIDVKGSE